MTAAIALRSCSENSSLNFSVAYHSIFSNEACLNSGVARVQLADPNRPKGTSSGQVDQNGLVNAKIGSEAVLALSSSYRFSFKFCKCCDLSRHPQECPGPRARKCPKKCFLSDFGRVARSAPKSAPKSAFSAAQTHSRSTLWGTFWPGPLGTPADGGRDCNVSAGLGAEEPALTSEKQGTGAININKIGKFCHIGFQTKSLRLGRSGRWPRALLC